MKKVEASSLKCKSIRKSAWSQQQGLYKQMDDLILNSPFYKKNLKADVPYKTNEKKIVEVFKETFTSAELDSTMILEKQMNLSSKTSLINRRSQVFK